MRALIAVLACLPLAAQAEPMQLKFAFPGAPQAPIYTQGVVPWSEEVTKASDGTLEVKLFPGMGLATPVNVYDRVLNGVADFGYALAGLYPQQFPRTSVANLPFETRSGGEAAVALWRVYESGLLAPEYTALKPVAFSAFANVSLHSRRPIAKLEDVKGMKISADSRVMAQVTERLGAAPVTMAPTEIYQALQRGVVEASGIGWPGILPFKLNEVVSHHLDAALASGAMVHVMNAEMYAKLPAKGRETIDRLGGLHFSQMMGRAIEAMDEAGRNYTRSQPGQTIVVLSPAEEARWRQTLQPVTDEWVAATPDGAKVLAAYRAEIAKVRAK
jgi:TRAP-type C4-dicarboxylate transport system substrate-binding protein